MNKTMEIFDEIYKIFEIGDLFIGRVNYDKNDYVNDNIEVEKNILGNLFYKSNNKYKKRGLENEK